MDWTIYLILLEIKDLSSNFEDISFSHIPRSLNCFVHELAKNSYGSAGSGRGLISFVVIVALCSFVCFYCCLVFFCFVTNETSLFTKKINI